MTRNPKGPLPKGVAPGGVPTEASRESGGDRSASGETGLLSRQAGNTVGSVKARDETVRQSQEGIPSSKGGGDFRLGKL